MSSVRRKHSDARAARGRLLGPLLAAIIGGAAALVLAVSVGAVSTGPTMTVAQAAQTSPSPSVSWVGAYRRANAGIVDIAANTTVSVLTPFGRRNATTTAIGSGFVLNRDGDILTAAHVVRGASAITVKFADGLSRAARTLGADDGSDVAVIHVSPSGLRLAALQLGSSAALRVGQPLALIGDPLGFERSLSTGVVAGLDRTIQAPNGFQIAHAIQTDAAMNPGNSGGPLLNARGQVIGIAEQIATGTDRFGGESSSTTSTGVGFAVPIDLVKAELAALRKGLSVSHAYLGVGTGELVSGTPGALVTSVNVGSPAAKAGLKLGDLIVAFNDRKISSAGALIAALAAAKPGQLVKLGIRRGSSRITLSVTLGKQPTRAPSS